MRLVIQRVQSGAVSVEDNQIARIGPGLIILLGIGMDDGEDQASYLANKVAHLRIFEDENGRINQSLLDIQGKRLSSHSLHSTRIREKVVDHHLPTQLHQIVPDLWLIFLPNHL